MYWKILSLSWDAAAARCLPLLRQQAGPRSALHQTTTARRSSWRAPMLQPTVLLHSKPSCWTGESPGWEGTRLLTSSSQRTACSHLHQRRRFCRRCSLVRPKRCWVMNPVLSENATTLAALAPDGIALIAHQERYALLLSERGTPMREARPLWPAHGASTNRTYADPTYDRRLIFHSAASRTSVPTTACSKHECCTGPPRRRHHTRRSHRRMGLRPGMTHCN